MKWSLARALGISDDEATAAELRAARIEESYRPDGAVTYIPETEAGALFQEVKNGLVAKSDDSVIGSAFRALRNFALGRPVPTSEESEQEEAVE